MTKEAFERVVRQWGSRVHSHAVWMLRDREEARDVAQEALMRLWKHREEVHEAGAREWLLRTAHRLCIDRSRRLSVLREVPDGPAGIETADPAPGPARLADSALLGKRLESALLGLSPRNRAVVLLREVEGLGYEEIAESLSIPLGTLKAALHRSREKLREALAAEGVSP